MRKKCSLKKPKPPPQFFTAEVFTLTEYNMHVVVIYILRDGFSRFSNYVIRHDPSSRPAPFGAFFLTGQGVEKTKCQFIRVIYPKRQSHLRFGTGSVRVPARSLHQALRSYKKPGADPHPASGLFQYLFFRFGLLSASQRENCMRRSLEI